MYLAVGLRSMPTGRVALVLREGERLKRLERQVVTAVEANGATSTSGMG